MRSGLALLALVVALPARAETAEQALATSRELLAVADRECDRSGREIVVCAQRNDDDRYRLPFETHVPGDPDDESVMAERVRLQANPGTCQGWSYFRAFCGSVGVSVSVSAGGGVRVGEARRAY